jgi:hypothetical protein
VFLSSLALGSPKRRLLNAPLMPESGGLEPGPPFPLPNPDYLWKFVVVALPRFGSNWALPVPLSRILGRLPPGAVRALARDAPLAELLLIDMFISFLKLLIKLIIHLKFKIYTST